MQTARRLYVYLISGVSLGVLVAGLSMLLGVGLERLGVPGVERFGQSEGERLTLAAALVVVALPVWLIHWSLAEGSVRPDRTEGAVERTSSVRGLYVALALGVLLGVAASGASTVLSFTFARTAGVNELTNPGVADGLAQAIAAGTAWAYHAWLRGRDWARGPMTGGGAWLPRTYLYVAAFAGLFSMLSGIDGLLDTSWRWLVDRDAFPGADAWAFQAASQGAQILVGGLVWIGHAWYADGLARDTGWRGDSERPARLRQAYFAAVVVGSVAGLIIELSSSAAGAIRWLTGTASEQLLEIVPPLVAAIPFAVAAWFHATRGRREAAAIGSPSRVEATARLEIYPVALVGLAFGAVGVARLLGAVIEGMLAPAASPDWAALAVADNLPVALLGGATWAWAWRAAAERVRADPVDESRSTVRRASLLIALAGSVLAGIGGGSFVLYRLFGGLFGIRQSGDAISELSLPIATLVVAAVVAAYHAVALRRDLATGAPAEAPVVGTPAPVGDRQVVALRLVVPPKGDVTAAIDALRSHLPPGFELDDAPHGE